MVREMQRGRELSPYVEVISRPRPTFHGMLITPETATNVPKGKKAIATFNAALFQIPNSKTHEMELVSVFRVQTDEHRKDQPDGTNYFGIKRFALTQEGINDAETSYVTARNLLAPEDIAKNPEDMRLSYDEVTHQVYGALTETMPLSRFDLHELKAVPFAPGTENELTYIPLVATVVGTPIFNKDTGSVEGIDFKKSQFAYEAIDGEERPRMLVGKNAWVDYADDGGKILRYRPEFYAGEVNQNRVRTLFFGGDNYWHRVGDDGTYPINNVADLIPQGNTLGRFGLNGKTVEWNGKAFRIDHVTSESPGNSDGKKTVEYGFITVGNKLRPLLSYGEAVALTGIEDSDLSGDKKVIYCNGYTVLGDRLVMAVTLFDKSIGIFSYDMNDLADYAAIGDTRLLEKAHLHFRRDRLV